MRTHTQVIAHTGHIERHTHTYNMLMTISGEGVVSSYDSPGWVRVTWDKGRPNVYRWGAEDKYDLEIVGRALPADEVRTYMHTYMHTCMHTYMHT